MLPLWWISIIETGLKLDKTYTITLHKELVRKYLKELNYSDEIVVACLDTIRVAEQSE